MTDKITSIQLRSITKERLDSAGKKGDTYDDIISRLLDLQVRRQ